MGQTAAEIESDIRRRRDALGTRISSFDQRVRSDVEAARQWPSARVDEVKARAQEMESQAVDKAKDALSSEAGSDSALARHPVGLLVGSAVSGFVLGMKTGHSNESQDERSTKNGQSAASGGILGLVADTVRTVIGTQTGALVETALDAGTSGLKSAVTEITGIGAASAAGASTSGPAPAAQEPVHWQSSGKIISYGDDAAPRPAVASPAQP